MNYMLNLPLRQLARSLNKFTGLILNTPSLLFNQNLKTNKQISHFIRNGLFNLDKNLTMKQRSEVLIIY